MSDESVYNVTNGEELAYGMHIIKEALPSDAVIVLAVYSPTLGGAALVTRKLTTEQAILQIEDIIAELKAKKDIEMQKLVTRD